MGDLKEKSLSGVKWSAIERFSNQGINFIIGIILANLLLPEDFGIIGMVTIFLTFSRTFIDSGFSNALIRKKDCTDTEYSTVFYFNIVVGIICYVILFLLSPWIARFFDIPILSDIVKVLALEVIINSLIVVQVARLTIQVDFKRQAKASVWASFVSGVIGIICAYIGFGVWALVVQTLIKSILNAIILWILAKWMPRLVFSATAFKEMFGFGSKLLLAGIVSSIYHECSTILIGKFYTPIDLGFYTRGRQFAHLPSSNITGILQRVTFPILAKIQDDDDRLINAYRKFIRLSSLCIMFMLVLLAALASPVIDIVLKLEWQEATIYLQLFCFAMIVDHINAINLNLLYVKGKSNLVLKLEIYKKSISTALLFAAVPFGVVAICLSVVLYSQIAVIFNTYYTGKLFNFGYFKQLKDFIPYFIISVMSCTPAFILTSVDLNSWCVLIGGCVSACMIYCILLTIKRDDCYMEYAKPIYKRVSKSVFRNVK